LDVYSSYSNLLSGIDASDHSTPIREIIFDLGYDSYDRKPVGENNWLMSALQNMATLESVTFWNGCRDFDNLFILATIQNEAIHTIMLHSVDCSEPVFLAILKQKCWVIIHECYFINYLDSDEEEVSLTAAAAKMLICVLAACKKL